MIVIWIALEKILILIDSFPKNIPIAVFFKILNFSETVTLLIVKHMNYISFISNLTLFKERLEKNIKNYEKNFKIEIEISVVYPNIPAIKYDNSLCIAMVKSGIQHNQCSRKKKYGEFCGLHNNMSTGGLQTVYSIGSKANNSKKETLYIEIATCLEKVTETYSSDNPFYIVTYNGSDYHINCITGEVYVNTIIEYESLGHINTLDIPIAIY